MTSELKGPYKYDITTNKLLVPEADIERMNATLRAEITKRDELLRKAPHEPYCASLTPRPMSISAFFDYQPPHCNCYKARFVYEQEKAVKALQENGDE